MIGKENRPEENSHNHKRKSEHLQISLNNDVSSKKITSGFENYRFIHQALPEIDLNEIDLSTEILGKKLKMPFMISPMVGGIEESKKINRDLAGIAQMFGIAMGIGSQRTALENNSSSGKKSYVVRDLAPDILLFANIGAVQLNYGFGIKECDLAVNMIEADALMLHLNPLQEAFQPGGNCNFKTLQKKISGICEKAKYPVLVREVGFGISCEVAQGLIKAGVSGIDTGGSGGTSWIEVEKNRTGDEVLKITADCFSDYGISTAESIRMVKRAINGKDKAKINIIASGGIRNGMEVAKAIALGADMAGIGLPVLKNLNISREKCIDYIREIGLGLKITMFGIGAGNIAKLKNTRHLEGK